MAEEGRWRRGKTDVGGLEGALEDGDGVVLSCHIGETLWAAEG
jgi:hypothetical protein